MGRRLAAIGVGVLAMGWADLAAAAPVSGYCTHPDRRISLVDGVAWLEPVEPEDEADAAESEAEGEDGAEPEAAPAPPIRLGLSSALLDAGDIARAEDREAAFRDQGWGQDQSGRLELTITEGAVRQQYLWMSPGTNLSYASSEVGRYQPGPDQPGRVRGTYRFTPDDGQDLTCEVSFDLAILGDVKDAPPLPGIALPADGGAPGAAYLEMNRALHAGDIETMLRMLPADRAAELRAARSSPDFPKMIAFAQAISPARVVITGGRQDGNRAWVEFTAVEEDQPRAGTAEMSFEGGRWIMMRESTRDPK